MTFFSQRIASLILKNLRDELSTEEYEELRIWANASAENRKVLEELSDEDSLRTALSEFYSSEENVWNRIEQAMEEEPVVPVRRMRPWLYVAAACITILLAAGTFWWINKRSEEFIAKTPGPSPVTLKDIVAPSGNNSTLVLGDGTVINIDSSNNGTIAFQGNAMVIKKEGILEYTTSAAATENATPKPNILRTSLGGQQSLRLPDGSYVLLNAQSSITYPIAFTGNSRKVQLTGEAYFEIKPLAANDGEGRVPFLVEVMSSAGETKEVVEVLGTHFTINAYDDEIAVKTTLIEGKVRMTNSGKDNLQSVILRPGQQAVLAETGKISVVKDEETIDAAMAWVRNEFSFKGSTVAEILREASRWYPITVSYPNGQPNMGGFRGSLSRNYTLAQILDIFKESGIKFRLEDGNKLIVTP